jgi:hypothetical protein
MKGEHVERDCGMVESSISETMIVVFWTITPFSFVGHRPLSAGDTYKKDRKDCRMLADDNIKTVCHFVVTELL